MNWNVKETFCADGEIFNKFQPIAYKFCPAVRIETSRKLTADERRRVIDALVKAASVEMLHIKEENEVSK